MSPNEDSTQSSKGIALITGGARGIGRAIALRLAKDGFEIAVNGTSANQRGLEEVEEIQSRYTGKGRKAIFVVADVSKEQEVKRVIEDIVKELGGLDVLIANAAVCGAKLVIGTTVEDWDWMFAINSRGVFLCYKYAALQMIKQGRGGRIIGASSIVGKEGWENLSAYSATKFAVRGLTHAAGRPYHLWHLNLH